MCLQHAESAFDGYNRGAVVLVECVLSLFFHVEKQEHTLRHHARVARLHKLQHPNTERCEATVHYQSRWRETGRLG